MSRMTVGIVALGVVGLLVVYTIRLGETWYVPDIATSTLATSTAATTNITKTIDKVVAAATTTKKILESINVLPQPQGWKRGVATVFWVGEGETDENGYITNVESAWDGNWQEHYGGVDGPEMRCGFQPCAFEPKENPFYVALPYNDLDDNGRKKANAARIPWYAPSQKSILKNRWIEVRANLPALAGGQAGGKSCFGQWEDVGPFEENDIEYVFGEAEEAKNQFGEKAGIDLSPALADCLGIDGSENVQWRHVEEKAVPLGDWKKIITTRI